MKTSAVFFSALMVLAGCDRGHDHDHEDCHAHAHGHGSPDGHVHGKGCAHSLKSVKVPESIQRVMGLKTVRPEKKRIGSLVSFPGRYELSPEARRTVPSPVAGRLTIKVRPLAAVRKGDALFTVFSPELVSRAGEISVMEKRLAVYREINTPNAELENSLAVKRAERMSLIAGAEEKDGTVTIRAESDGIVESYAAQDGQWLETGTAVLVTVRPRRLRFKALAAASDAMRLKDGLAASVNGAKGEIRLGVGDDSGLVPVYVVFENELQAVAGGRAEAVCTLGDSGIPQLAVPAECIVRIALQPTVFARDAHDAGRFIAVPVTPGQSGGGWTAVEGLPAHAGEIVKEGVYELKLALPGSEAKISGHFHADGTFHEGEH